MFKKLINKVKFLLFCWYKGHLFGTVKYEYSNNTEIRVCARCGFKKKRKYQKNYNDDYFIC